MTITQKMRSPWYFVKLPRCHMTLEKVQKPLTNYFPVSKAFGHSPMKKPNAPLLTLSVCPLSQFSRSLFQKSQSHSFSRKTA